MKNILLKSNNLTWFKGMAVAGALMVLGAAGTPLLLGASRPNPTLTDVGNFIGDLAFRPPLKKPAGKKASPPPPKIIGEDAAGFMEEELVHWTNLKPEDRLADQFVPLPNGRLLANLHLHPNRNRDEVALLKKMAGDPYPALRSPANYFEPSHLYRDQLLAAAHGNATNAIPRLIEAWSEEYQRATSPFNKAEILQREQQRFAGLLAEARRHPQVAFIANLGKLEYDVQKQAFLIESLKVQLGPYLPLLPGQDAVRSGVIEVPTERARAMLDRVDNIHAKEWREKREEPGLTFMAYVEGTIVGTEPGHCAIRLDQIAYFSAEKLIKKGPPGIGSKANGPGVHFLLRIEKLKSVTISATPMATAE